MSVIFKESEITNILTKPDQLFQPKKEGRTALFSKFLTRMPIAEDVREDKLAAITEEFSGTEIEHATNEAGLLAVQEAIASNIPPKRSKSLQNIS